jgi:hypothetical protein
MPHLPLFRILTTAALLLALPAHSQDEQEPQRWYDVELIVFQHLSGNGLASEKWPLQPELPDLSGAIELDDTAPGTPPLPQDGTEAGGEAAPNPIPNTATLPETPETPETPATDAPPFQRLGDDDMRLQGEALKLNQSAISRVLYHGAWRQPGLGEEEALAVHIHGGQRYVVLPEADIPRNIAGEQLPPRAELDELRTIQLPSPPTALEAGVETGAAVEMETGAAMEKETDAAVAIETGMAMERETDAGAEMAAGMAGETEATGVEETPQWALYQPGQSLEELDGTIKVVLKRYLHVYADLAYRQLLDYPQYDEELNLVGQTSRVATITMKQHRRMRSRELHYLDHPLIGILVLITPYEPDEPAPAL